MRDKQNITIQLADVGRIRLAINPYEEEVVREAEKAINQLWQTFVIKFENRSPKEALAMVAFNFAKAYFRQLHEIEGQAQFLAEFENELDRLLAISPTPDPEQSSRELS